VIIVLADAGTEKMAPWFAAVRQAQNELVSSYSEKELGLIVDFFEKSTVMSEESRKKLKQKLKAK
jgi:hypothetical protein